MTNRCPLCRAGVLESVERRLVFEETVVRAAAWHCPSCRELVLDAAQIEQLRTTIRAEGLAASEEQVEHVLERLMLQPG